MIWLRWVWGNVRWKGCAPPWGKKVSLCPELRTHKEICVPRTTCTAEAQWPLTVDAKDHPCLLSSVCYPFQPTVLCATGAHCFVHRCLFPTAVFCAKSTHREAYGRGSFPL